jgi:Ca2+-binding RTX toxin-like protein
MQVDVRHRFAIAVVALIAAIAVTGPSSASLGANVIYGTNGPDVIEGTPEVDVIFAKSGDDTISNVGDGDIVYASSGNDTISVVPQTVVNDVSIDGNVGNDTIFGGSADDSDVNLGSGHDVAYLSGCGGRLRAGSGNDLYFHGDWCAPGTRTAVEMGNGNDQAHVKYLDSITLGNGHDLLNSSFPGNAHTGSGNDIVDIDLGGFATLRLGSGNDRVSIANAGDVTIFGSSGADHIIVGHSGNNVIKTESGNDRIDVSDLNENNRLDGGPGYDHARISDDHTSGTTCRRIERVTDFDGNARSCS